MAALLFPSKVRDQVLEQHADLRELLREAVDELTRDAEAGSTDRARLAARGRELCARFHEHLLYEDEELMPVLAVLDTWGPERVRERQTEHARQRRKLGTLWSMFDAESSLDDVAAALRELAEDLLRDMEAEEEGCLGAPAMSAALLHVERV